MPATAVSADGMWTLPLTFLWLELTGRCNLTCTHCYAESGPHQPLRGNMTCLDWCRTLREASSLGCRHVQFIGGEPTLHPDFRHLVALADEIGFGTIEVYTNATTLTGELASFFAVHGVLVATSFYSADPATHERITGRIGSFERTVRGIQNAIAADLPLRAGVIETRDNRGHWAGAKAVLEDLGVRRIGFDRERGIGRGHDAASLDPMGELCGHCGQGKLCITAEGRAFPCVFSRFVDVGCATDGLRAILGSASLRTFRDEQRMMVEQRFVRGQDEGGDGPCEPDCVPLCEPVTSCNPCEPGGAGPCEPFCSPRACTPTD